MRPTQQFFFEKLTLNACVRTHTVYVHTESAIFSSGWTQEECLRWLNGFCSVKFDSEKEEQGMLFEMVLYNVSICVWKITFFPLDHMAIKKSYFSNAYT